MEMEVVRRRGVVKDAEIESKDQRWHCRNRVTLVFGSNDVEELDTYLYDENGLVFRSVSFHQAKSKAIEEILDNSIDEFYRGHVTEIRTVLSPDKKIVTISDNGIGFPHDKIRAVYAEFRTGSKFRDEEVDDKGFLFRTLGQNGLGAAATCLTCDFFKVTVRHYLSKKEQTFLFVDGANQVKKTPAKSFEGASGVKVELSLAAEVYKDNVINEEMLRKRIIDLAYNNPGLTFYLNGEKYLFKQGLSELAERCAKTPGFVPFHLGDDEYTYSGVNAKGIAFKGKIDLSLSMVFSKEESGRERFISFVNSTPTYDGGFHHERVKKVFTNLVKEKLERVAKKEGVTITDNDILSGTIFIVGITMPNPRFESQTKRKLVRDVHLDAALNEFLNKYGEKFIKKSQEYLDAVVERARHRQRFEEMKEATKKGKQQKRVRVEKLLDANERKDRSKCTLFICEGDSAIGGLRSARDKLYQGGMAIKGKPMNVAQSSIKDVLANQELCDIMASVGLTLGAPVDFDRIRYSKIVFLADADVDGGHINTLLTNFFFIFWPELFAKGMIQIARPPLYEVILEQGKKVYVESIEELERLKKSGAKVKEIQRNKGLGEMSAEAFRELMARKNYIKITVEDMEAAKRALEVCFGKDTNLRKDLLLDQ
ncbi:MAG: ATP-binding protein [Oligoflexia bacterium]|nr:ATP-binding protein [Oligoflexia bacterium]